MIEEGKYKARASSKQFMESSKKGTEYISVVFKISQGEPHAGMRAEWKGWLTDGAMERTLESLCTMGWDGVDLTNLGPLDKEVEIDIQHEDDDKGNPRERVAWVNEIGRTVGGKPMTPDAIRRMADKVKARSGSADAAGDQPRYDRNGNRIPF